MLTSDFEVTTHAKGNPFSKKNKAVCLGYKLRDGPSVCLFDLTPFDLTQHLCVFFNAKFDLHWYRRQGFTLPSAVWCCQLAEFILGRQQHPYPSLEETAQKYGLGSKIDLIKEEFWERKCSCHVSIVERIVSHIPVGYVNAAIVENTKLKTEIDEIKKKLNGEKTIQTSTKETILKVWKTLSLILIDRLDTTKQGQSDYTNAQMSNMLLLWSKLVVQSVDQLQTWSSTTTTKQEKLENVFVEVVTQLLGILKKNHGIFQHSTTCTNTPIDTDAIPPDILSEYCRQDVDLTYAIYLRQQELFIQKPGLYKLFKLACQDLLILEEMEWNGLVYDEKLCEQRIKECQEQMQTHLSALRSVYPGCPLNFNSGDQLSAFLYGGTIVENVKLPDGIYKTGMKKGQPKFKNGTVEHVLPRMVEPLPKTELAKPGLWATNEPTLKKLKGPFAKKYVEHILGVAKQDKLIGTYYEGIPKLNKEMDWEPGMVHGQLNQVVASTGRLSSTKPNTQNQAGDVQDIYVSRYDN